MSRYHSSPAQNFGIKRFAYDSYRMAWTVDFYYASSRLRHGVS